MLKKRVLLVFGTRPDAIKMAPLVKEFQKYPENYFTLVAVTGQHREMLDQVLKLFEIVPDYDLDIMKKGQDLCDLTSQILQGMRGVLDDAKPDYVFVHGDTTTSMAAALSAFYRQIPVAHIEAGLRTNQMYSPWPEEINRQITGRIASLHFAPTHLSKLNLINENIDENKIWVTGNTVIDALSIVVSKINVSEIEKSIHEILTSIGLRDECVCKLKGFCQDSTDNEKRLVLITGHRRENFGTGMINICKAISDIAKKYQNVDFVYPMHLNPKVRNPIDEVFGIKNNLENVKFIEPLDYLPFIYLMNKSYLVLTDSGGIQEEAAGLGKPVLVMRNTTERPEALAAGTVKLVGTERESIVREVSLLLDDKDHYARMSLANNPYEDGNACTKIISILLKINNKS